MVERRVLTVDRDDLPTAAFQRRLHHRTTRHEAFLVGESNPITCFEACDRRPKSRGANDPVDNRYLWCGRCLQQCFGAEPSPSTHSTGELLPFFRRPAGGDYDSIGVLLCYRCQPWCRFSRRQRCDSKAQVFNDLQRLSPDRTGRAEHDHRTVHSSPKPRNSR